MVTLRKRARTLETPASPKQVNNDKTPTGETQAISGYEQFRDKRIKENLERMEKLGIIDLSLKLKADLLPPKRSLRNPSGRKTPQPSPLPHSGPSRRSSRLQNITPVSYSELRIPKKDESLKNEGPWVREGSKPEVYTEEQEKLLGTCEASWTLFVDGYGSDGRRVYDPVKGKTCHQCRQKTLGHRTHCSKCNMVQGQFCGDCLYMRYGEHVLEANQNPNWVCPVCRGICNCSLCRQAKGWAPTGSLYRKVSGLGFKSVAHYLIQSRPSQTNSEEDPDIERPVSAKRSIPFADIEEPSQQELLDSDNGHHECSKPQSENNKDDDEFKGEEEEVQSLDDKHDVINVAPESDLKLEIKPVLATKLSPDTGHNGCSISGSDDDKNDYKFQGEKEKQNSDNKENISNTPDSIAARLRQRRNSS